eukprot:2896814-Pleurochrysis_carterae.AAC.2
MDELETYPDARNMFNDRLLDLVKYTAADGGQSAKQVGQFQKTRHNVYWDDSRRQFIALPYFPENPQSRSKNLFWWKTLRAWSAARVTVLRILTHYSRRPFIGFKIYPDSLLHLMHWFWYWCVLFFNSFWVLDTARPTVTRRAAHGARALAARGCDHRCVVARRSQFINLDSIGNYLLLVQGDNRYPLLNSSLTAVRSC